MICNDKQDEPADHSTQAIEPVKEEPRKSVNVLFTEDNSDIARFDASKGIMITNVHMVHLKLQCLNEINTMETYCFCQNKNVTVAFWKDVDDETLSPGLKFLSSCQELVVS